jgi:hypothetical protein
MQIFVAPVHRSEDRLATWPVVCSDVGFVVYLTTPFQ